MKTYGGKKFVVSSTGFSHSNQLQSRRIKKKNNPKAPQKNVVIMEFLLIVQLDILG